MFCISSPVGLASEPMGGARACKTSRDIKIKEKVKILFFLFPLPQKSRGKEKRLYLSELAKKVFNMQKVAARRMTQRGVSLAYLCSELAICTRSVLIKIITRCLTNEKA